MFFYSMKVKFAGLGFTIFSCKIFKNEKKESNLFRLMKIHEKNYIHHDLHSGNILSHDRPHNHLLIFSILKGERPWITKDTPEFYAKLMKRCWDHNPGNSPTAREIRNSLYEYNQYSITKGGKRIIELAEAKRQEITKSEKFLSVILVIFFSLLFFLKIIL